MKYNHIVSSFFSVPWALLPEKYYEIHAWMMRLARGEKTEPTGFEQVFAGPNAFAAPPGPRQGSDYRILGPVAVVPIQGTISQRAGLLTRASGGVGAEEIGATLETLAADPAVKKIVLQMDSPGGSVFGLGELAERMRDIRRNKRITASVDPVAASAAYWIASQANEVTIRPDGQAGSIGVIAGHLDTSAWEKQAGYKTTLVTSAPYKAEMASEVPLSEAAQAELQSKVDHYHQMFVKDVAKGRGNSVAHISENFGQGRMLTAQQALRAGMVDRIETLSATLGRLGAAGYKSSVNASTARMRYIDIQEGQAG